MVFAVKGNIIFTKKFGQFEVFEQSYIVVENETVKGIYQTIDDSGIQVFDYGNSLIIPGLIDLHVHAPQFSNMGLGLDKELIPWLNAYTFPEEVKYQDREYAKKVYSSFVKELWKCGTTRACVFGTIHKESTKILMELFHEAGLCAFVGKVNMDLNSPDYLIEDTLQSIMDTTEILEEYTNYYDRVKPIITPRFVPSCSLELLNQLGELAKHYQTPVQSHLSENVDEISFVKELYPNFKNYASIYEAAGLFGDSKTIMAHCVLVTDEEIELMKKKNIFVAHCPNSNCNLSSGIAPIRKMINHGIEVGLGSDISGGHNISLLNVMISAAQVANLRYIESNKVDEPFSTSELFYMATKGGGKFFGKVGSFESGYEFDALVIDDGSLPTFKPLTLEERLQRFIYTGDDRHIKVRFVAGKMIEEPKCYL